MMWCYGVQKNNASKAFTASTLGVLGQNLLTCTNTAVTNSCHILFIPSLTGAEFTLQILLPGRRLCGAMRVE